MLIKNVLKVVLFSIYSSALLAHGVADDRIERLTKEINEKPSEPSLYIKRGKVHLDVLHHAEALEDFKQALSLDKKQVDAWFWTAKVRLAQGRFDEAIEAVRIVLELTPDTASGYELLAAIQKSQGNFDDAVRSISQAIALGESIDPDLIVERAHLQAASQQVSLSEIEKDLINAIADSGPLAVYYDAFVKIAVEKGAHDKALTWIKSMPAYVSNNIYWFKKQAEIHEMKGDKQAAKQAYQKLVDLFERLPEHRKNVPANQLVIQEAHQSLEALSAKN